MWGFMWVWVGATQVLLVWQHMLCLMFSRETQHPSSPGHDSFSNPTSIPCMKVRGRLWDLFTQKYIGATLTVLREVEATVTWQKPSIMRSLMMVQPLGDHHLSGSPDTLDYLDTTTQWPYAGHLSNIHEALSAAVLGIVHKLTGWFAFQDQQFMLISLNTPTRHILSHLIGPPDSTFCLCLFVG